MCEHIFDKILQVCYNTNKAYCKDGRRFKSYPPEMEVSYMEVLALVMQLLHLITDIIRLTFDFSNKKK